MVLGFLAFYLISQLGIGYWASRSIKNEGDYLLAGRSLGPWLTTFGIFATWFGAETCIGAAGRIYDNGLSGSSAEPFGYALCIFLMGLLLAVPIWKMQLTTLGDLYRIKFGAGVEKIASLLMIPTSLFWAAAQIRGFGVVLNSVSGWDIDMMNTIAACIVLLYTSIGGLLADSITDLIQGILLLIGLITIFVLVSLKYGLDPIQQIPLDRLQLFNIADHGIWGTLESWSIPILGSLVAAELITRAMAAKTAEVAKYSSFKAFGLYLGVGLIPVYLGLIGPIILPDLEQGEQILPLLAKTTMPLVIYAIFSGALISAILSTVDSSLLASGSLFSHNIILRLYKKTISNAQKVLISRLTVATFGIIAYIMAIYADGVYSLVEQASAFGSAGLVTCVLFGALTNFGNQYSAYSSLLGGLFAYIFLSYIYPFDYPFLGSLFTSILLFVLFAMVPAKYITSLDPE